MQQNEYIITSVQCQRLLGHTKVLQLYLIRYYRGTIYDIQSRAENRKQETERLLKKEQKMLASNGKTSYAKLHKQYTIVSCLYDVKHTCVEM